MTGVAAIVLAGGESRRMGEPKLVLRHAGATLLARAVHTTKSVADSVSVVVGAYAEVYGEEARRAGAAVVINEIWEEGLASSLRAGVAALPDEVEVALILLGDQPFIEARHLQALVSRHTETGADLVFSSYQGILGAPTLLHRSLFEHALNLKGDVGAKALKPLARRVEEVPLAAFEDIDTPEDRLNLLEP